MNLDSNMKVLLIFVLVLVNPALCAPQRSLSNALINCKENGVEYEKGAKIPTNDPCEYCECVGNGEKICFASRGQCWPWHLSFKNEWQQWQVDYGICNVLQPFTASCLNNNKTFHIIYCIKINMILWIPYKKINFLNLHLSSNMTIKRRRHNCEALCIYESWLHSISN